MSDKVILNYNGNELELPVATGSMDEKSIDISKLRSATGLITMDPGYKNTGACESKITFLDGEEGKLMYRGYPIEQLAEKSSFVEVMYLLIKGELPTQAELDKFITDINEYNYVSEDLIKILDAFPSSAHPMGVLTSLTAALSAFNPKVVDVNSPEDMYRAAVTLLGKFPVLASWTQRKIKGLPVNYSNDKLSYVENFYQLLFKKPGQDLELDPVIIDAIDKLLILHADHEQNCSTSSVRLVGSSHAGLFASISGGISALWGPLHGGANQAVLEMLEAIKNDGGDVEKYLAKAKDKNDPFRLMGFGHRVYKNFDPRAKIIKVAADNVLDKLGINDPILDIAKKLEKAALEDEYFKSRNLYPNVDFYSGIIYKALDIPTEMFTVMFAVGRLPGWIAQWMEMRETNQPIGRPRQLYTGAPLRDYVEIEKR
ncbi:citrate synthase [Empedobacter brevis]|uniref:Citrate synthase n=1 Tax=Empedobacter brevis NBRC 14943 = ATCC 43319 TaxID=1218108 RepID=A0A511NKP5_9FLAO|nr:citrate synthase [Empedobacter brevis]QES91405.1 citrate synthase [Empedobacter brevis]QHC86454.1 type II citrate synthase [Empedobacter brevis]GEM53306.1 citrate synthase [Empedobacter brevis NBRC 14943 = ATCC 43319]